MLFTSIFDQCFSPVSHLLDHGHRLHGVLHHPQGAEDPSELETSLGCHICVAGGVDSAASIHRDVWKS